MKRSDARACEKRMKERRGSGHPRGWQEEFSGASIREEQWDHESRFQRANQTQHTISTRNKKGRMEAR